MDKKHKIYLAKQIILLYNIYEVIFMSSLFGNKLCALRKSSGLSQKQLAQSLNQRGVNVTNQAVSKWESGASLPNAAQFLAICDIIGVTDIGGSFLGKSSELFAGLNDTGKQLIIQYSAFLRDSGLYDDPEAPSPRGTRIRSLPVYNIDAASGTGKLLDCADYTLVQVGSEVPLSANFGVIISGDGMEPDYHNGQTVWIHQQPKLQHGDVGVFIYEGNCYFKRLRDRVGGTRLQCIDANYPDVIISTPENLVAVGKAVI